MIHMNPDGVPCACGFHQNTASMPANVTRDVSKQTDDTHRQSGGSRHLRRRDSLHYRPDPDTPAVGGEGGLLGGTRRARFWPPVPGLDDLAPIKMVLETVPLDLVLTAICRKVDRRCYPANPTLTSWR